MYESFESFLRSGVKQYYERSGREQRTRFVALLITSGEALPLAADAARQLLTPGRLAASALGALALRVALRWAVGGPLGLVLTGMTVASLVAYYFSHQDEIRDAVERSRSVLERTRSEYWRIQDRFAEGTYDVNERNLMIDGLLQRFLREIDAPPETAIEVHAEAKDEG